MKNKNQRLSILLRMVLILVGIMAVVRGTFAQQEGYITDVREIEVAELGVARPAGLAFSPEAKELMVMGGQAKGAGNARLLHLNLFGMEAGVSDLGIQEADPLNIAFDRRTNSLYLLEPANQELVQLPAEANGKLPPTARAAARFNLRPLGLQNARGMAFDPESGTLYVLDPAGKHILRITPDPDTGFEGDALISRGRVERINLSALRGEQFRGLAFNPANKRLYILNPADKIIYALTEAGEPVTKLDVSRFGLVDPQGMVFAPSGDSTDDPGIYNLYVADQGGTEENTAVSNWVVEFSLTEPVLQALPAVSNEASLANTIDTSRWNPPSPDPAGIDYLPATGNLLIADSEVDEMKIFQNKNVYESTPGGSLVSTCVTLPFSKEPTGVAVNPANGHIFFSDDGKKLIHQVNLGPDGKYCTGDDFVTSFSTVAFNSSDPEGVAFGEGSLFIADGLNTEVYRVRPGPNGIFDGVPPGGDDQVSQFDVASMGLRDPEGIGYHPQRGTLFIVSRKDKILVETTTSGTAVNIFNISFLNAVGPAGVGAAPGSQNPSVFNVFIAARGVDNNVDPNENDGKVYEVSLGGTFLPSPTPTLTSTPAPSPTSTSTPPPGPSVTPTPTPTSTATNPPPSASGQLYLSLTESGSYTIGGVSGVRDEDILRFDNGAYSLFFDGSDVGVGGVDLEAFSILDSSTILMTFNNAIDVPGAGLVEPFDIVRFNATSLGANTAGSFSLYFDGSDVGLDVSSEAIDAFEVLPDGRILISTSGNISVPGVSGKDEDILAFTPTSLGENTSGSWAMYFDGSDVGLTDGTEDIDGFSVAGNGDIYLTTTGAFAVNGVSGDGTDVFICTPTSLGETTACTFATALYFQGSAWGLTGRNVDAIER